MDPSAASATPTQSPYNPMIGPSGMLGMQALNFNNILNVKDSRWLQLEVCREFQRNKCTRPDTECKFAHPPSTVEIQNGRVTACYDSIKGRCSREKPPCKYFHPPQHLKDQLLINGRNHLALKNAFMTQLQAGITPGSQYVQGSLPIQQGSYLATGLSPITNFGHYIPSSPMMTVGLNDAVAPQLTSVVPQQVVAAQKVPRTDRLETFPGMGVPYKRPAPDKSGVPVYQPAGNTAYHQALMQQLGGQTYVPVSCEYGASSGSNNLLTLPPPNTDAPAAASASTLIHPSPANHNAVASSSSTPSTSSSSSQHELSYTSASSNSSSSTSLATTSPTSYSSKISTSSTSASGKIGAHLSVASPNAAAAAAVAAAGAISNSASQTLPGQPVNMLTYAALNKGLRANLKSPPTLAAPSSAAAAAAAAAAASATQQQQNTAVAAAAAAAAAAGMAPNSLAGLGALGYNFTPATGIPLPTHSAMHAMIPQTSMAGFPMTGLTMAPGIAGGMGTMGTGFPVMPPQLVYSQYPASSLAIPQLTALSSNPQSSSLAQATEQPYKKLKTS